MDRSIVAAVDGSPEATNAARSATRLARDLRMRLVLAVVVPDPQVFPAGDRRRLEVARRGAVADGRAVLEAVAEQIEVPDAHHRVLLSGELHGGVAERLAEVAREEDAELVVIGTSGRGVLAHLARQSVATALVERSARPVVVVPPGAAVYDWLGPRGGVLLGADGSPGSNRARLVARELAGALGAEVQPVFVDQLGGFDDPPDGLWVEVGEPASSLADIAERRHAAVVVVGTRERVGLASVARQLIRLSSVPVVVVSPDARVPRLADARPQAALAA